MSPQPTPERIFTTLTAYQASAALVSAIELELFTHVAAGTNTLGALARATGASERGLRALANHLVAEEFLVKQGERYSCSSDAALFLDGRSPAYMGSMAGFLNSKGLVECFDDLTAAVKRGGTVAPDGGTTAVENPVWVDFARAMQPMARAFAGTLAECVIRNGMPRRVLDIAAGHGVYGIEIARRASRCEVVFQDWKNVLAVARENATKAGLGARAHYLPGSAFDVDFGKGNDAVLFTNFLHHFERAVNVRLLTKARASLAPEGAVAVLEFALDDGRVSPPASATFDLVMLASTPHGEAFTLSEYAEMFGAAGLTPPERTNIPGGSHAVLLARAKR